MNAEVAIEVERAQAVDCNGLPVAVPYRWARTIVDDDTAVPVPNAPAWLVGAANIEGRIVAVVDLHAWVDPLVPRPVQRSRLLLGGDGEDRLALRFEGLPQMVHVLPEGDAPAATADAPAPALPSALRDFHAGWARSADAAGHFPVIDVAALARHWAVELST